MYITVYCSYLYNLCMNRKEEEKNRKKIQTAAQKEWEELKVKEEKEEKEILSLKQEIENYKNRCNERDIEIDNLYTEMESLREKNVKLQKNLEKIIHYINFLLELKRELLT